jgi:type VI secretion system secreted protein VgrG
MPIKQDSRSIAIATPLGPDVLGLRSFSLQEQISRLFQIEAELSSEDGEVDLDKVVGHNVSIRLQVGQQDTRYFNGIVSRLVQVSN